MAKTWHESVRGRGELRVYPGPTLRGDWTATFELALRRFNELAKQHGLGVRLVATKEAPGQHPGQGADVQVDAGDGQVSATYAGATITRTVSGSIMHGNSPLVEIDGKLEKVFVLVPANPLINTPRGSRPVGPGVKLVILVHELVHACGLTNAEHGTADLFHGSPQPDYGRTAAEDRLSVTVGKDRILMPPLRLTGQTAGRIRALWT
jgi:hypothetical protein